MKTKGRRGILASLSKENDLQHKNLPKPNIQKDITVLPKTGSQVYLIITSNNLHQKSNDKLDDYAVSYREDLDIIDFIA